MSEGHIGDYQKCEPIQEEYSSQKQYYISFFYEGLLTRTNAKTEGRYIYMQIAEHTIEQTCNVL